MFVDRRLMLKTLGAVFTTPLAVLQYTTAEGREILQPVTDIVPVKQDDVPAFFGGMSDGRIMRVRLDGLGYRLEFDGIATDVSFNYSRGTEVCLTLQSSGQVMCSHE